MKPRLLIVDDEKRMVDILGMVLRRSGYEVDTFVDPEEALVAFGQADAEGSPSARFDLLITDLRMPGVDGLEVLRRAREIRATLPVILMTAHASVQTAIEAMKQGAVDYVEKPFSNDELKALVKRALDLTRLERENRYLRAELKSRHGLDQLVAESEAMQDVFALVKRSARSPSTVLIGGESGTGKELVARALHFESDRVGGPFVAANCKAFAEGVLESELFGHERGAFTGAERTRAGLFEQADHGTLLLDEIGEVSLDFQAKLLRVLQEKSLRRVGGSEVHAVDVRIVAATNRNLREEVNKGRFREDLYFRLAVIPIHLPALRERREDIVPLARHFLDRWNGELSRTVIGWSEEVGEFMARHPWPGNVRELENAIERGVVLARGDRIELEDLLLEGSDEPAEGSQEVAADARNLHDFLDSAAARQIRAVLDEVAGVRTQAAERLGVDRTTLYRLMRKYGISRD
jgi:two-component system NtrC family response regulator